MLETYVIPTMDKMGFDLNTTWFQQDGAPWHRTKRVIDFLKSVFAHRIYSLGTNYIWPPRSQDLTPLDFFFWDYMKMKLNFKHSRREMVFQKNFRQILAREMTLIPPEHLRWAIDQVPTRLEYCMEVDGKRFSHLLHPERYDWVEKDQVPGHSPPQKSEKKAHESDKTDPSSPTFPTWPTVKLPVPGEVVSPAAPSPITRNVTAAMHTETNNDNNKS